MNSKWPCIRNAAGAFGRRAIGRLGNGWLGIVLLGTIVVRGPVAFAETMPQRSGHADSAPRDAATTAPATENPASAHSALADRLERRAAELREEFAARSYHVTVESPFVVIGNESAAQVKRRATGTVRWAVARLRAAYFRSLPDEPIELWLLADDASYRGVSQDRFGITPTTPFGYFSARHRALVTNIQTGAGTLVHEIVHPLMAANFPNCPPWFDEGLASLYEECTDRDGQIWGLPNWRLRGLEGWVRDGDLPSFQTLCQLSRDEFYGPDAARNYAQARYLCLYLQHHGQLGALYREMRAHADRDPSGWQALCRTLHGMKPPSGEAQAPVAPVELPDDFRGNWEKFIEDLAAPATDNPT